MEAYTSFATPHDSDEKNLKELLEVFGSSVTVEEISSAYRQAERDVNVAGEILSAQQGKSSGSIGSSTQDKLNGLIVTSSQLLSEPDSLSGSQPVFSSGNVFGKSHPEEAHTKGSKSNRSTASMGTVSGIIGKGYGRPRESVGMPCEPTKPLKLNSNEWPVSEIWSKEDAADVKTDNAAMRSDVQEFLFKMLGDGFNLEKDKIQEVLGQCGYDMQMGMEQLFHLSASTLKKGDDIDSISDENANIDSTMSTRPLGLASGKHLRSGYLTSQQAQFQDSGLSNGAEVREKTSKGSREKGNQKHEKEILQALFTVPERSEEGPKRMLPQRNARGSLLGEGIKPLKETIKEALSNVTVSATPLVTSVKVGEEDNEDSYDDLRKGVKEFWAMMKEYYKAAVDAFVGGNNVQALRLLDQGHYFNEKAREADEKSVQKLCKRRNDEIISVDLRSHEPREALRLLKSQLASFSGIPSFKYLRVIVGTGDDDTKKGARKRLIQKLLEKNSIASTEEDGGRVLQIQVDVVNPKSLSWVKK